MLSNVLYTLAAISASVAGVSAAPAVAAPAPGGVFKQATRAEIAARLHNGGSHRRQDPAVSGLAPTMCGSTASMVPFTLQVSSQGTGFLKFFKVVTNGAGDQYLAATEEDDTTATTLMLSRTCQLAMFSDGRLSTVNASPATDSYVLFAPGTVTPVGSVPITCTADDNLAVTCTTTPADTRRQAINGNAELLYANSPVPALTMILRQSFI